MKRAPVALVTGAGRGIGRGIAWALAEAGYDVVVNDLERNAPAEETLAGVVARGRCAAFVPGDIARLEGHATLVASAWSAFGTLDCLVNNAGVSVRVRGDMLDVTPESFDRLIGVNLRGTFFLTQTVAKRMVAEKRTADDPPRAIVTISSSNAITVVGPNRAEYCIAKTGLAMMSQLYAERLAAEDIMCYEVRPGIIRTDMTAVAGDRYDRLIAEGISPVRRWGEPEDVGRTVATLASRAIPFNTGEAFHIDGGFHMKVL